MFHIKIVREIYDAPDAYTRVGEYIINPDKCDDYFGAYGTFTFSPDDMMNPMYATYQRRATTENFSCLFHVVISLKDLSYIRTLDNMFKVGLHLSALIGATHQNLFALHFKDDSEPNYNDSPHLHFMINAVSWIDGSYTEPTECGRKNIYKFVSDNLIKALANTPAYYWQQSLLYYPYITKIGLYIITLNSKINLYNVTNHKINLNTGGKFMNVTELLCMILLDLIREEEQNVQS